MTNHVHVNYSALQAQKPFKYNRTFQKCPSKCKSYATTFYKYNDLTNKFPCQKKPRM
jgi:hypothetical protein